MDYFEEYKRLDQAVREDAAVDSNQLRDLKARRTRAWRNLLMELAHKEMDVFPKDALNLLRRAFVLQLEAGGNGNWSSWLGEVLSFDTRNKAQAAEFRAEALQIHGVKP